ncbi:MAG: hypothetical protein JWM95_605 [Gemmatimonadetes bacterium]|nr:hypothetical protein [Gemmatimonadota bacterium]
MTFQARAGDGLLCVCNFPSNTGFAWDFIESLYAMVADELAPFGVRTVVAYPRIDGAPRTLEGHAASAVHLPVNYSLSALVKLLRFVRDKRIRAVYLSDRSVTSPLHVFLRLAGVEHIVVHDHTSGARQPAFGVKRLVKLLLSRFPGLMADEVIAVSDYVLRRQVEVALVPSGRAVRVWNGVEVAAVNPTSHAIHDELAVPHDRQVVVCCCRAHPSKGVAHVLRAFDDLWRRRSEGMRPALAYVGDGPERQRLEQLRTSLASRRDIHFLGYRTNVSDLLAGADVCVSASTWQEAFGLAVLEPMALGRAVVGTRVGGVPEILLDGETGLLVEPGDESGLSAAIERLLDDPELRASLGAAAHARTRAHFTIQAQVQTLSQIVSAGLSGRRASVHPSGESAG